jgi:tryptophan 2,3-dioxygenase
MQTERPDLHTPLPVLDATRDVGRNHYWSYHDLPALLACKRPLTASADEDLFIAVHQVCELSFHQMILDLGRTLDAWRTALAEPADGLCDEPAEAVYFLARVVRLWRTVNVTMPILGELRAFAQFRTSIGPTSGFQSAQFRRVEIMSGVARAYWQGGTNDAAGTPHVAETAFDRRHGEDVRRWLAEHRAHSLAHHWGVLHARLERAGLAARRHAPTAALRSLLAEKQAAVLGFHRAHLHLARVQLERVGPPPAPAAPPSPITSAASSASSHPSSPASTERSAPAEGAAPPAGESAACTCSTSVSSASPSPSRPTRGSCSAARSTARRSRTCCTGCVAAGASCC